MLQKFKRKQRGQSVAPENPTYITISINNSVRQQHEALSQDETH
jgi:hypothetical protein